VTLPTLIADAPLHDQARSEILTADALAFLTELHHRFDPERRTRLAARSEQ
jgi:malate synthase